MRSVYAVKVWVNNFAHVEQLYEYPAEIRKIIYTTNIIEAVNSGLRKVTNRKAALPSNLSVMKILFLCIMDITAKWTMPIPNWALIRCKHDLLIPGWAAAL